LFNFLVGLQWGSWVGWSIETRISCSEQHYSSAECQNPKFDLGNRGKPPDVNRTISRGNLI
jgi:hypothetical protein